MKLNIEIETELKETIVNLESKIEECDDNEERNLLMIDLYKIKRKLKNIQNGNSN